MSKVKLPGYRSPAELERASTQEWHERINRHNAAHKPWQHWMYDAKDLAEEAGRLPLLFERERKGALPKTHRQCSHSESEQIQDNHLTCALGVACRDCPHLKALEERSTRDIDPAQLDQIKAWTCIAHINAVMWSGERGDPGRSFVDTSEGYVLTTGDRMYWDRVYQNMACPDPEPTER